MMKLVTSKRYFLKVGIFAAIIEIFKHSCMTEAYETENKPWVSTNENCKEPTRV